MANYAQFEMRVVGDPLNVKKFIEIMQVDEYDTTPNGKPHFFRIFEAHLEKKSDVKHGFAHIDGYCAWSIVSCMTDVSPHTYYNQHAYDLDDNGEIKLPNATHLAETTKKLNLKVETFAEEAGVGFEEHIIYDNGEEVLNDVVDMVEYLTDDYIDVHELNKESNLNIDKETFAKNEYIKLGGFDIWDFTI